MITKNKMKQTLLIPILFILGLSLLLTNCETTDFQEEIEQNNVIIKKISLESLSQKEGLSKVLKNISNKTTFTNNKNTTASDLSFIILTDNILETQTDSTINYTFPLQRPVFDNTFFENFVISKFGNEYKYFIVKYQLPTPENFENMEISFTSVGIDLIDVDDVLKTVNNVIIAPPCVHVTYSVCGNGGNPNGHGATGGDCVGSFPIHIDTSGCFGGIEFGGGSTSTGAPSNPNNNGGSYNSTPSGATAIIEDIERNYASELIGNNFSKTDPVWDLLNNFGTLHHDINTFLEENNNSQDAQEHVLNLLEISMSENPAIDINLIMDSYIISPTFDECTQNLITRSFITKDFLEDTVFGENIKNTFILNPITHISFKPVTDQSNTTSAKTNYVRVTNPIDPVTGQQMLGNVVTIEFNNDYLNQANDIAIVTTIFHEILHAYIIELYYNGTLLNICPEYTELNDAFDAFINAPNYPDTTQISQTIKDNLDNEMHNIYEDYIEDLAESIHTYAIKNNFKINNNVISLDYARNLIWGSLQNENVSSNNPTQTQASIIFNDNVLNNLNNSDGTPTKSCD